MFNIFIDSIQKDFGFKLSEQQINQFRVYYQTLIEYNKKVNLTRITEENEVYYKHFYDSLTLIGALNLNDIETICDMGAGAGFPSIPLKILFPHLKITIIDSLGKRIKFLQYLLELLSISDVELIYDRIEIYAKDNVNKFDIVTARALGSLTLILELGLPMVKEGKIFVAYKGSNFQEEIEEAKKAFKILNGKIIEINEIELPFEMGFRSHIVIKKMKHVNGYPRAFAAMKKHPLS